MAMIIRNSCGAFIDHSHFKFTVSTSSRNQHDALDQPIQYEMKREFFDIYTPFYLDSQAQRILLESQTVSKSDQSQPIHGFGTETSAQRKRRKKKPPVLSDAEEKVSELLERVFPNLVLQVKDRSILVESSNEFLETHSNNKASRMAALNLGCGEMFQEMCTQETLENTNFRDKEVAMSCERLMSKNHDASSFIHKVVENSGQSGIQVTVGDHTFFIPACSRFLISSFSTLVTHFHGYLSVPDGYDLIVMDPPWSNKSVKRKKSYQTFDESELCCLPLHSLCKDRAIICVWVTNNERILSYVKDVVFPTWNVKWIADWFWMKVTKCGVPICDIRSSHKKPYERLVIGRYENQEADNDTSNDVLNLNLGAMNQDVHKAIECQSSPNDSEHTKHREEFHIPEDYVLVSVPCSLHSKKPPLSEALSPYLPSQPKCLELFARNLMPGWTSWGNEVLRHQHRDYYEAVS